jgi:hypothetical protein
MVPIVASVAELPDAIKYADDRPSSRWFVSRRAIALDAADQIPESWGEALTAASNLSTDEMAALGKKGQALRNADGTWSYPTRNRGELAKAIQAFGRARNKVAAKRYLLRRIRALHAADLTPDSWKPIRAAAEPADEVSLWKSQVVELLTSAGLDPVQVEDGTDGFEADYEAFADDPQGYVDELIAANADTDDEADEDESDDEKDADAVTEPEAAVPAPVPVVPTMPVAAAATQLGLAPDAAANLANAYLTTTKGSSPSVQIFTAPAASPASPTVQIDVDALVAAIKAASREAVDEALTAAKKPPVDDTTGEPLPPEDAALVPDDVPAPPDAAPAPDAPVDMDAAKAQLRGKFGPKPGKKPKAPPVAASVLASAAAMRERMAARTAS